MGDAICKHARLRRCEIVTGRRLPPTHTEHRVVQLEVPRSILHEVVPLRQIGRSHEVALRFEALSYLWKRLLVLAVVWKCRIWGEEVLVRFSVGELTARLEALEVLVKLVSDVREPLSLIVISEAAVASRFVFLLLRELELLLGIP